MVYVEPTKIGWRSGLAQIFEAGDQEDLEDHEEDQEEDKFQIFVNLPPCSEIIPSTPLKTLNNMASNDTILAVKRKIVECLNANGRATIAPDQLRLIFANKDLDDVRSLGSYGIKQGSTIEITLRGGLRGGDGEDSDTLGSMGGALETVGTCSTLPG